MLFTTLKAFVFDSKSAENKFMWSTMASIIKCSVSFQPSAQKDRSALCPTFQKADFVETESHRPILSGYFFFFFERGLKGVSGGGAHLPITQLIRV